MQPDAWWLGGSRFGFWERLAVTIWMTAMIVIAVRVAWKPSDWQTVYPVFHSTGQSWLAGDGLYHLPDSPTNKPLYRYSPLIGALLVPFGLLPMKVAAVVWRCLNLAVFLGAFAWWARAVLPRPLTRPQIAILFLLLVPLSVGSVNNGQINPLVIGLLLAAVAASAEERWFLAAVCAALAALMKVYPLALGLLLAGVYPRRFLPRFVAALGLLLLLPFLLQRPDYVWEQYVNWGRYLIFDDRTNWAAVDSYRDLRLLLTVWVAPPSHAVYVGLQLAGALLALGMCLLARWLAWPQRRLLTLLTALGCGWMILLGPSTETCTYILLAPTLAWGLLACRLETSSAGARFMLYGSCALFLAAMVACWHPSGGRVFISQGPNPAAALLLLGGLLLHEYRWYAGLRSGAESVGLSVVARAA